MSNQPKYRKRKDLPWTQLTLVFGIASLLVAGVLVMTGGSDDPVAKQIVPPLETTGDTSTPTGTVTPETSQAIDGAPLPKLSDTPPGTDDHEEDNQPIRVPGEAADADGLKQTVRRFAQLNINRPTDPIEAAAINKELIGLSTGQLARDLENNTGSMVAAQIPSRGRILTIIQLDSDANYREMLVVTEMTVIDIETKQPLDPTYINYLVRVDKLGANRYAVTSWEPQY